jgi:transposase
MVRMILRNARRTMKKKKEELELALQGYVNPYQRLMLKTILTHIDFLTEQIEMLDQEIAQRVSSYQEDIERLIKNISQTHILR